MVFPIRGHSYMECDRNMGLINQKSYVEVPDDWITVIANSRQKPSPFLVKKCDQSLFLGWTAFFETLNFKEKCPFKSRPIREVEVNIKNPRMILVCDSYSGAFSSITFVQSVHKDLTMKKKKRSRPNKSCLLYTSRCV